MIHDCTHSQNDFDHCPWYVIWYALSYESSEDFESIIFPTVMSEIGMITHISANGDETDITCEKNIDGHHGNGVIG